jgi:hypothetical protein
MDATDRPLVDAAFLLRLLIKTNPRGYPMGAVRPNKFAYHASVRAAEAGIEGFRYRFIRAPLGPMDGRIAGDMSRLEMSGFVRQDHAPTAAGTKAATDLEGFFEENPDFTGVIDGVARKHWLTPRHKLVADLHATKVLLGGKEMTIDEAPLGTVLFDPAGQKFKTPLRVSEEWEDTLALVFDPGAGLAAAEAAEAMKASRVSAFGR